MSPTAVWLSNSWINQPDSLPSAIQLTHLLPHHTLPPLICPSSPFLFTIANSLPSSFFRPSLVPLSSIRPSFIPFSFHSSHRSVNLQPSLFGHSVSPFIPFFHHCLRLYNPSLSPSFPPSLILPPFLRHSTSSLLLLVSVAWCLILERLCCYVEKISNVPLYWSEMVFWDHPVSW